MGGFTPLLFAARHGDVDSARLLLDAGANVNETAADGLSVLVLAAHSGHTKLVTFLRADYTFVNERLATHYGIPNVYGLLGRGADVNAAAVGYTALHAAVLRGDLQMISTLLEDGADPNARLTKGTRVPRDTNRWVLSSYLVGHARHWGGGFSMVHNLGVDADNNLYISESAGGHRIQRFLYRGMRGASAEDPPGRARTSP